MTTIWPSCHEVKTTKRPATRESRSEEQAAVQLGLPGGHRRSSNPELQIAKSTLDDSWLFG